ncbi:MAG TPA: TRAP transporter large permease subunit [Acetobacteraceae bacterium]|nr:TRAP transporter large permease subunit [Acetobacteraceae bacterium]
MSASEQVAMGAALPTGLAARLDRLFGLALELAASALVIAEVVILFIGIIARYVFEHPLIWSDELASLLFLWLAMLGTVIALRRGEHMRMTALINRFRLPTRYFFDQLGLVAALVFFGAILLPAYAYMNNEAIAELMSLGISTGWRAAAMPIGIAVIALTVLLRVLSQLRPATILALITAAILITAFVLLHPALLTLGRLNLLIFFLGVVTVCVFAGIPIAVSFGLATLGYLAFATRVPLAVLVARMDTGMSHPVLLSVPLFVFLGLLIEMTGMAQVMVRFLANLLGHVRGGLSFVLIGAMYLVSGISGSKAADMAAVAPVLFPEMEQRGATRGDLVALLAATGAQTETIPPSLILITIGSVTSISIAALFTGGLLPGLVVGLILCIMVGWRARLEDRILPPRATARDIGRSFLIAIPALVLPFVIRGAVVGGIATATEVSTIGIVYSVLAGVLIYRKFDLSRLLPMLVQTAALSGAILLIVGAATSMAWAITSSGFSRVVAGWIAEMPGGAFTFMAISILLFVVLGSVLEGIPVIVLFGPLLFPLAKTVGINEVHYAMVAILAMGVGLFAPPFGVGYYVACAIGRCNPDDGMRHIWRYLAALIVGLIIVAAVPWISIGFL